MSERLSKRERHAVRTDRVSRRRTPTRVLITGVDHPNKGATGILRPDDVIDLGAGVEMTRVDLEQAGAGGVPCAYATPADLMPVTFSYGRSDG